MPKTSIPLEFEPVTVVICNRCRLYAEELSLEGQPCMGGGCFHKEFGKEYTYTLKRGYRCRQCHSAGREIDFFTSLQAAKEHLKQEQDERLGKTHHKASSYEHVPGLGQ